MIIISVASEDEASVVDEALRIALPPGWPYRIYLQDREFHSAPAR